MRNTVEPASAARRTIDTHVGPPDRVERGGRFVEDHETWVPEQCHRQPESLLHALREAADGVPGAVGQAHVVERTVDRGGGRRRAAIHRPEPRVKLQHLPRAQPRLVAEELGQVADLAPRRTIAERRAEDRRAAARRARQPEEQLHRCRLACAVGAEEAEDLARFHAQGQVDQGIGSAVALRQATGVDDRVARDHLRVLSLPASASVSPQT